MRLLKLSPLPPEPEVGDVGDVRLGGGGVVPVEEVSARTEAMASCWVEWGFGFWFCQKEAEQREIRYGDWRCWWWWGRGRERIVPGYRSCVFESKAYLQTAARPLPSSYHGRASKAISVKERLSSSLSFKQRSTRNGQLDGDVLDFLFRQVMRSGRTSWKIGFALLLPMHEWRSNGKESGTSPWI
jgi:hypothetical protein